uniref:Cytosol aminopeptidase domain-containing protein n=1 Tax=Glossina morsitans morsitans TaxID=37546 RepID=A0A1B0GCJ5_GLOMM
MWSRPWPTKIKCVIDNQRVMEQKEQLYEAQRMFVTQLARLKYIKRLENKKDHGSCPICRFEEDDRAQHYTPAIDANHLRALTKTNNPTLRLAKESNRHTWPDETDHLDSHPCHHPKTRIRRPIIQPKNSIPPKNSINATIRNLALVGKGIVYDTGGLSIKGKTAMAGMKRDCGGAAATLGAFYAAVKCDFKQNLHGIFCLAENSVGPLATRQPEMEFFMVSNSKSALSDLQLPSGPEHITYFRTIQAFEDELAQNQCITWLVCFYIAWNSNCVNFAPIFAALSAEYNFDTLKFGKFEIGHFPEIAQKYCISV